MLDFSVTTLLLLFFGFILLAAMLWLLKKTIFANAKEASNHQSQLAIKSDLDWCIFYASQRGRAKHIAQQTAEAFRLNGKSVACVSLSELSSPKELAQYSRSLFIVSTFRSGQAPESSRKFAKKMKKAKLDLSSMQIAILALGDKQYDRFCGFGFSLNRWLKNNQAIEIKPMVTVNQMDKTSIVQWQEFIQTQGGDITAFNNIKPYESSSNKD